LSTIAAGRAKPLVATSLLAGDTEAVHPKTIAASANAGRRLRRRVGIEEEGTTGREDVWRRSPGLFVDAES
jgi:hypothetical protein